MESDAGTYTRLTHEICGKDQRASIVNWRSGLVVAVLYAVALVLAMRRIALLSIIVLSAMLLSGCGATVTINVLSSHSRYGQAIGGTNPVIEGQIEGGGALTATVPTSP